LVDVKDRNWALHPKYLYPSGVRDSALEVRINEFTKTERRTVVLDERTKFLFEIGK